MKNIEQILADAGVTVTDEQKATINKEVKENYKTVNDWQKHVDDNKQLQITLTETKEALKKFDGVDAEALNKQIADLKADLEKKDSDYQAQIADRDFQDNVKGVIAKYKGKNEKAIKALLDMDNLKASKNQNEDLDKAVKALTEAEDSKMLFGDPEPEVIGKGDPIGVVRKTGNQDSDAQMRAVMGLPPVQEQK